MTVRTPASAQATVRSGRRSVIDGPTRVSEPLSRRATVMPDRALRSAARKRFLGRVALYGGTLAVVAILVKRLPLAGAAPAQGPGGQAMADPASVLLRDPLLLVAIGLMIALAHLGKWLVDRAAAEAGAVRADIGHPPRPATGSWGARIAGVEAWWKETTADVKEIKETVKRDGVWGWRHKLVPYLTAVVVYFSVLLTLMSLSRAGGTWPGMVDRIGIVVPAIVFGLAMVSLVLPAALILDRRAAAMGIARGVSDVGIGMLLNSVFLYQLFASLRDGVLPSASSVAWATAALIAGGAAGFSFWRAEGYPERPASDEPRVQRR